MLHRMHDTPLETCSTMRCIACAAQDGVSHILFCPGPHLVRHEGQPSFLTTVTPGCCTECTILRSSCRLALPRFLSGEVRSASRGVMDNGQKGRATDVAPVEAVA